MIHELRSWRSPWPSVCPSDECARVSVCLSAWHIFLKLFIAAAATFHCSLGAARNRSVGRDGCLHCGCVFCGRRRANTNFHLTISSSSPTESRIVGYQALVLRPWWYTTTPPFSLYVCGADLVTPLPYIHHYFSESSAISTVTHSDGDNDEYSIYIHRRKKKPTWSERENDKTVEYIAHTRTSHKPV